MDKIYKIFLFFLTVSLAECQQTCVFGPGENCSMPCGCESADNSTPACDPITGYCFSSRCKPGHSSLNLDYSTICRINGNYVLEYSEDVALYLVHPLTRKRITNNILNHHQLRGLKLNCDYIEYFAENSGSLVWEFDLQRLYSWTPHSFQFLIDRSMLSLLDFNRTVGLHSTMLIELYNKLTGENTEIVCRIGCRDDPLGSVEFTNIYITFLDNLRCERVDGVVAINPMNLAIDMDCSRCLHNDTASCQGTAYCSALCGNGLWCERCADGWRPPDCRRPCEPGYRGVNCLERYSYDWKGSLQVFPENRVLTFQCDTIIPLVQESVFTIHVQKYNELTGHFEDIGNYSFSNDLVQIDFEANNANKAIFRATLSASVNGERIYGRPSMTELFSDPNAMDNLTKNGNPVPENNNTTTEEGTTITENGHDLWIGFAIAFSITAGLLSAFIVGVIICYCRNKANTLRQVSADIDQRVNTAPARLRRSHASYERTLVASDQTRSPYTVIDQSRTETSLNLYQDAERQSNVDGYLHPQSVHSASNTYTTISESH